MNLIREGQTINGKYQIIKKIGEGATSRVYLAYDLVAERNVSLKVLKEDNLTDKKIKNFKREAHAISLLDHKNIIKIYEINDYNGTYFIAQEYIDGMSLKEYIENSDKVPSITTVIDIVIQILEGLSHAHEKKVIHKDIKSQNILLGINKEVKITDFGIADVLEDDVTKTQSLMGTPQYVAPEVLNKGVSTHQTDIYSTGILLYELLIGHAPFYGEKPTVIILKQLNQPIPSVKQQRDDIPQSLENILIKATAKKLSNRYKDAEDMIDDLRTCFNISRINEEPLVLKNDFALEESESVDLSKIKEQEEEHKTKISKNYVMIFLIFIVVLIAVVIVNLLLFFNSSNQLMPDLEGRNYKDGIVSLDTLNIDENQIEIQREENNEYDKDDIISTTPKAGEEIDKDDSIIFIVSNGVDALNISNYVGMPKDEAVTTLENLGLNVEVFYEKSDEDAGLVVNQSIEPNEEVLPGDSITLIVSEGLQSIKVKDLLGSTEDEFDKWTDENNLNSSKTYICSNKYPKGEISSQDPTSGTEVKESSSIKVEISTGSCKTNSQDDSITNNNDETDLEETSDEDKL